MKKSYTAPYAEKVNFNYKDQVVASGAACKWSRPGAWTNTVVNCDAAWEYTGEGSMNNGN